jgi:streptogramin lyase
MSFCAIAIPFLTVGCGSSTTPVIESTGVGFTGKVFGGQQPIINAAISLYASGSDGPGKSATNLLKAPVYTDADGKFSITGDYVCPSATTQVYIVSRGGNPGLSGNASNPAAVLMTAIGDCDNLSPSTYLTINEATSAAAAWALAQFLSSGAIVGASPNNGVGLRNAFASARNLVDTEAGSVSGAILPAGAAIEGNKLATLANALATCVNSTGTIGCSPLFSASTVGLSVPTNTLDAARNIVLNPANRVADVFNVASAEGPFQPALKAAPNDWTMSITFTGGNLSLPRAVAVDSQGSVWAANESAANVTRLSPNNAPLAYMDSSLEESFGITIDANDNVWVTNLNSSYYVNDGNGSVTEFNSTGVVQSGAGYTAGGIYYPAAIAAGSNGSIWVADFGRSATTVLSSTGSSLSGSSGYESQPNLPFPSSVALDSENNAWFGAEGRTAKVTPSGVITSFPCCQSASGVALDHAGNVWLSDYSGSSIVELDSSGSPLQTVSGVAGIDYPKGIAIDGNGNAWVSNYHADSVSAVSGASSGPLSAALSSPNGFGLDANLIGPIGLAFDESGNLWVANSGANAITQFVGIATPVSTPLLGPPKQP